MSKRKYSPEWMMERVQEYLSGQGSYESIAKANGINDRTLREWTAAYRQYGDEAFAPKAGNAHYTKEFKIQCVEDVLFGGKTESEVAIQNKISCRRVLIDWIRKYNANMELNDYDPQREVYMAESRRKTTQDERKEIVEYCISHGRDYKGTAVKYDASYSQVYSWVRKYDECGEAGLKDNRGHHKTDEEVDETERLRRENLRLKRQLEEQKMLVELLKKVREFEER